MLAVDAAGGWVLDGGFTLGDVTHRPCRAARYRGGTPAAAAPGDFPVAPGAAMPAVAGCDNKVDYAVLFVVGLEEEATTAGASEL